MRSIAINHNTPAAPTRSGGMLLGASGVSAPPLQILGITTGPSSADGNFNDSGLGYGQISYDSTGKIYICDRGNVRIQRFTKNSSGVWLVDSKFINVTTALGGGSNVLLLDIDRTRNEIHVGAYDHYTASNWISVWSLADWPNLTSGNRVRQYGANANSDIVARSNSGRSLRIDSTFAVVTSYSSPYRILVWNHVTGVLVFEETQSNRYAQFETDQNGNWWCSGESGAAENGLYKIDISNLTNISRLDTSIYNSHWRAKRFFTAYEHSPFYYNGKIYARDYYGRVFGFNSENNQYIDTYIDPGSLEPNNLFTGKSSGQPSNSESIRDKCAVIVDSDSCAWLVVWQHGADNTATQDYLGLWPLSVSSAVWSNSTWPDGENTISGIALDGVNLSAEKYQIKIRKNSGTWYTVKAGSLNGSAFTTAISGLGTFQNGDQLDLEIDLSTWDRLDGNASLGAVRDKLSPSNVNAVLLYTNSNDDNPLPASTAYEGDKIALETRLRTTTALSGMIIKYDNAKVEDPGTSDWVACSINYSQGEEAGIGEHTAILRRYTGVFFVQVFTKEGKGSGSAVRLADSIADRFRGKVLDGSNGTKIRCLTPLLQQIGADGKGHFQVNVAIPFRRDTQH